MALYLCKLCSLTNTGLARVHPVQQVPTNDLITLLAISIQVANMVLAIKKERGIL
tara:strand:- start:428 stop:592 length:165 start_codon:yes stop_codon:yes gene_type:complete